MKIALFKPYTTKDKIICFFTRGKYSHVAAILNDGSLIDARPFKGVQKTISLLERLRPGEEVDVYEIKTTVLQQKKIEAFLKEQVGKKYDYVSVFGFVLFTNKENREARNKWFCSELIFTAFLKVKIKLLKQVESFKVSPTMISYSDLIKFKFAIKK